MTKRILTPLARLVVASAIPARVANGTIQIDASPDTQPIHITWK